MDIIKATAADIKSVAPLFDLYRQFYEQSPDIQGAEAFLKERIEQKQSVIFFLKIEKQIVGFMQLYPGFSSVRMRKIFILNDLYVIPSARKHGIGEALILRAVEFAKGEKAHHLVLSTAKNNPAQHLYKRLGWKKDEEFDQFDLLL